MERRNKKMKIMWEYPSVAQPQPKITTPLSPPSQGGDEGEVENSYIKEVLQSNTLRRIYVKMGVSGMWVYI